MDKKTVSRPFIRNARAASLYYELADLLDSYPDLSVEYKIGVTFTALLDLHAQTIESRQ